jgi:hypothetical protein
LTGKLQHAAADIVEMALQWDAEDRTLKTGAGIALSAAIARYKRILRKRESGPPAAFGHDPVTKPKARLPR